MDQEHDPGCDRPHSRRQLCSVARADAKRTSEARSRGVQPGAQQGTVLLRTKPRAVIPELVAHAAVEDELLTSIAPLAGVGLAVTIILYHPFWVWIAFLASQPFLFAACCVAGIGWSRIRRPEVALVVLFVRIGLVIAAFASVASTIDGASSYIGADGLTHRRGVSDPTATR